MVTSVVSKEEDNTLIKDENIIYWSEHRCCYGTPQTLEIGVEVDYLLELDGDYDLYFNDQPKGSYRLHRTYAKELEEVPFIVYVFMTKESSDILNNLTPNERSIYSISLESYIKENNNQLSFLTFELRKKGLILTTDFETKASKQFHIQERLQSEPIDINLTDFFIQKTEDKITAKRFNYYTIIDGSQYPRTTTGKGISKYIPFLTNEEITGLNNYLVATHEIKTDISHLVVGDCLVIDGKKLVAMESDFLGYNGTFVTTYILGELSK